MEPNYVLRTFLKCIKLDGYLDNILASNCVFEWFGKTIKTKPKIKQFCRYELRQQYEQNFTEANHCLPFECKPSHLKTMTEPIENFTKCNAETSVNYNNNKDTYVFETPTEKSSLLLNSIEKISSLNKSLNDDDLDDDDEMHMSGIEIIKTPTNSPITIQLNNSIKPLKRKRKQFKKQLNLNSSEEDDDSNAVLAKKLKLNSCDDSIPLVSETIKSETTTNSKYSKLYHLEAHGMIRTISKTKHNCITNISIDNDPKNNISDNIPNTDGNDDDDDDDVDDHYSINYDDIINSSRNYTIQSYGGGRCWDRRTKLNISYRIGNGNLSTSSSSSSQSFMDIQIALIIFQHITKNVNTRRNLLTDFDETMKLEKPIGGEKQRTKIKPIQKSKVTKEKTLTSLRRLRF